MEKTTWMKIDEHFLHLDTNEKDVTERSRFCICLFVCSFFYHILSIINASEVTLMFDNLRISISFFFFVSLLSYFRFIIYIVCIYMCILIYGSDI